MDVVFRAEAAEDARLARDWHDDQRPGLGSEFVLEPQHLIDLIRDMPDAFPAVRDPIRRALLHRFPYAVYYRATENGIEVLACLHMRRSDDALEER